MALRPLGPLLVLVWLLLDVGDPSRPGVFFFEAPQLFLDGAIATSSDAHRPQIGVPHQPAPAQRAERREVVVTDLRPGGATLAVARPAERRQDHHAQERSTDPPPGSTEPH